MPFVTYNPATGTIINFYTDIVGISTPYIQITNEQWNNFVAQPNRYLVVNNQLKLNPQYEPSLGIPILPISEITHAVYRNSNDTQTNVKEKTRLLIDGLGTGSFNTIGLNLYDVATSKVKPSSLNQSFLIRISFVITPTVGGTNFNLSIDVPAGLNTGNTVLVDKNIQLPCLKSFQFMESYPFYVGAGFLESGGIINISADRSIAISKASVYIIRLI